MFLWPILFSLAVSLYKSGFRLPEHVMTDVSLPQNERGTCSPRMVSCRESSINESVTVPIAFLGNVVCHFRESFLGVRRRIVLKESSFHSALISKSYDNFHLFFIFSRRTPMIVVSLT